MGFLKNRQLEQDEMWFSAPLGYAVCTQCVADPLLAQFIAENASGRDCSFCERSAEDDIAADTDAVLEHMSGCLRREWSRPIDEYLYDSESPTGYAGAVYETWEIFEREHPVFANAGFEEFVLDAFSETQWCPRDFAAISEGEALEFGWSDLADTVKHHQRFFFALPGDEVHDDGPGAEIHRGREMLEQLGHLLRKYGLLRPLPASAALYRCRLHRRTGEQYTSAKDLGAPPPEKASQSRMSPAGIPMFYAADDAETALAETYDEKRSRARGATIATFRPSEDCQIIDLSDVPPVPSIFDPAPETTLRRQELRFLHGFRRDVGGHVERDGREHIDYVPTQVVSEYLRHVFRDGEGERVHGLAWESSKLPGTRNVVMFMDRDHCIEPGERPCGAAPPFVELAGAQSRRLD